MPIERDRYPHHWEKLSRTYRSLRNWQCEQCLLLCRRPGENLTDFCAHTGYPLPKVQLHPKRFCLTTAHLNQNPGDNRLSNRNPTMQHTITITVEFDESNTALILSKCQQLSEFLQISGIKVKVSAESQTLAAINQQLNAPTNEPSPVLMPTTAQTAAAPSVTEHQPTTNS